MSRRTKKTCKLSLRVGGEVAALLRAVPNSSAFIRHAILAHAGRVCPLCRGTGVVLVGVAEHFAEEAQRARADPPPDDETGRCSQTDRAARTGAEDDVGADR